MKKITRIVGVDCKIGRKSITKVKDYWNIRSLDKNGERCNE